MFRLASLAALVSLSTGCIVPAALVAIDRLDRAESGVDTGFYFDSFESNAVGTMRGALPDNPDFERDLVSASVWTWDDRIDFDLHSLDGGWAMIGGGMDLSRLVEGETVVFEPGEHEVYGCSGPGEWEAAFDEPAQEVRVTTETIEIDGEPMIEMTILASFGSAGEVEAVVVRPEVDFGESD